MPFGYLLIPSALNVLFWVAFFFFLHTCYQIFGRRRKMPARAALAVSALCATLFAAVSAQSATTTSYRPIFSIPSDVDNSVPLLPNIRDAEAINPQDVCPGYTASNVKRTEFGLTANLMLAGAACNVYGTDVSQLNLTVEFQSDDRLNVQIVPSYIDSTNSSWFILPEVMIPRPGIDEDANMTTVDNDLSFTYTNDPSFAFTVIRQSTGDVIFDTTGTHLVFENQFVEFVTSLPENYNLYGLGEAIHGFRLGNNFTRTFWAADAGGQSILSLEPRIH